MALTDQIAALATRVAQEIKTRTAGMVTSATVTTIWSGTQAQYDAIPSPSPTVLYLIVEP